MEREETLRRENAYLRARVQALEKEIQILKSGRQSLLIESDLLDDVLYPDDSIRQSTSGYLETIEVMEVNDEVCDIPRCESMILNIHNFSPSFKVVNNEIHTNMY